MHPATWVRFHFSQAGEIPACRAHRTESYAWSEKLDMHSLIILPRTGKLNSFPYSGQAVQEKEHGS